MTLDSPKVMGIVNVTPDSFFQESRVTIDSIIGSVGDMLEQGADFIDVGGYSSRPNAEDISAEEESGRVIPAIAAIKKEFPKALVSIDTFRSKVAKHAIDTGADLINDISGGHQDPLILEIAGKSKIPFIGMHMRGNPGTMQSLIDYDNLLSDVAQYFHELKKQSAEDGILDLIIDPGFGFAKTLEQNYYLLKSLSYFKQLDCPILVGISRKSMIYKLLEIDPVEAMNGTTALNTIALINGANILRVHDVKEAIELVKLTNALNDSDF